MTFSPTSWTDRLVILVSVLGIGFVGFLALRSESPPPEEEPVVVKGALKKVNGSVKKPPRFSRSGALAMDLSELFRKLRDAHTFENPEDVAFLCRGMQRELGFSDELTFPPKDQILSREEYRRPKVAAHNRLLEYRLAQDTATDAQNDRIRSIMQPLYLEQESLYDRFLPKPGIEARWKIAEMIEEGAESFYVRYIDIFLDGNNKDRRRLEKALTLSDDCLANGSCPLIQFEADELCVRAFRLLHVKQPWAVEREEYVKIMKQLRRSTSQLLHEYSDIGWTVQECWRYVRTRLDRGMGEERVYLLVDLGKSESLDQYLKHMVLGVCLDWTTLKLTSESGIGDPPKEYAEYYPEARKLCSLHFETAWLLQPEDSMAAMHQLQNAQYNVGSLGPEVWLSIISRFDHDHEGYWEYTRHLGYAGAINFAEKCQREGAVCSDVAWQGLCAIERYAGFCPPADIWNDPQVSDIAAACAKDLVEWIKTADGQAEAEFLHRHCRHFAGSILIQHRRYREAAELAMAVPDEWGFKWFQPRFANSEFGSQMLHHFGSEVGLELAEIESLLHSDKSQLNETHLEPLQRLLERVDGDLRHYPELRLNQIQMLIALRNGESFEVPHTRGSMWLTANCKFESRDDTCFELTHINSLSSGVFVPGFHMPRSYGMSFELQPRESDAELEINFRPRTLLPEDLRDRPDVSGHQFVMAPKEGLSKVEVDVSGLNVICRINGREVPLETYGDDNPDPAANYVIRIKVLCDVPLIVSNATFYPGS